MSADTDVKAAISAFQSVWSGKAKITVTYFDDGDVQLFLRHEDRRELPHAQGSGKTLDEAAVALRSHLASALRRYQAEVQREHNARVGAWEAFHVKCTEATVAVDPESNRT
jgi:hypothetical protein